MPHIVAKSLREPEFPIKHGDFTFQWIAKPLLGAKSSLVGVSYKDKKFLLEIKQKDDKYIIKVDKTTRPSPTNLIKEALLHFCAMASCEKIADNLSNLGATHAKRGEHALKNIDYFLHSFPDKEVWIEIGFGSGRHLLYQAKTNPDIIFIGIEIHKPSIEQVLKQIALQHLSNIYVVDYDARLFLELTPSNSVGKIFIHFPVPWDKKPHRRVISEAFIQEASRVLKPSGVLELRTDSDNYFRYALDLFLAQFAVDLEVTKNIEPPIVSKYEARWRRLGKDIYDIRMKSLQESPPITLNFSFDFKDLSFDGNIIDKITTKALVFEDYFVHFEKVYKIDDEKFLIKLSFGSFDRPEHKYIYYTKEAIEYFPKPPVISRANKNAHNKIKELFHG
ncbi:tRNA (guanosine(46)-N7)-methyltransferase TrmB [Nitratiruptor sp. YY09-18]|uniref:tRNA (guanosine(46)-N7)-methyltransferase TrmB n=1 Tax=Nitratiruptor sp. YY09-18 TaxID=2724901 RepID=UPI0019167A8E|nr:tRNA (guanosine(46)-N7)-methyltransferase TrmB [Nitratiruptor sp. YY09-18]BCD67970.1 tRNA (guanine-N7-)-methyltransferase [Nitratiruptor sp. YY09-18]